jgi:hypothetical protein
MESFTRRGVLQRAGGVFVAVAALTPGGALASLQEDPRLSEEEEQTFRAVVDALTASPTPLTRPAEVAEAPARVRAMYASTTAMGRRYIERVLAFVDSLDPRSSYRTLERSSRLGLLRQARYDSTPLPSGQTRSDALLAVLELTVQMHPALHGDVHGLAV